MSDGATRGGDVAELPGADGESFTCAAPVTDGRVVRVVFGPGSLSRTAAEARALGSRIFLIAGRHAADAADAVAADLGSGLVGRVDEVVQHVPAAAAAEVTATVRAAGADVLVSVGGGSATGLAKAVARQTGLPVLAVPSTYAGSEMTAIWGETDETGKATGRDPRVLPRTVVYDPTLTLSMPTALTAASGMNAMAHAVESLYAPDATDRSRGVAEEAIHALAHGLPRAVRDPDDLDGRTQALRGAWLAGWALGSTTMGLHHKLAHVLGGRYNLPHASVHSALLPQVAAFNAPAAPDAFGLAARALGVSGPDGVGRELFDLAAGLGAPTSLAELGLASDALGVVAEMVGDVDVPNPRAFGSRDLWRILRRAYWGRRPHRFVEGDFDLGNGEGAKVGNSERRSSS